MKPEYAIKLDNYFPDFGAVRLRKGCMEYVRGLGTAYLETLIAHDSGTVSKLYAIGGGKMYDITTPIAETVREYGPWAMQPVDSSDMLPANTDLSALADGVWLAEGLSTESRPAGWNANDAAAVAVWSASALSQDQLTQTETQHNLATAGNTGRAYRRRTRSRTRADTASAWGDYGAWGDYSTWNENPTDHQVSDANLTGTGRRDPKLIQLNATNGPGRPANGVGNNPLATSWGILVDWPLTGTVRHQRLYQAAYNARFWERSNATVTHRTVKTALKDGLTNSRWSQTAAGGSTILVNGHDDPMRIQPDGTLAPAHGWTGIATPSKLWKTLLFKKRVFFAEKDTAKAYYGPLNGVQGALEAFDFAYEAPEGGNLLDIGTMTIDSGTGVDDLILFFMSKGVVLLYRGIDPAATDDSGFFKAGKYKIGALVGDRPLVNVGGDLFVHTVDGIMSMQALLERGRSGQQGVSVSDAIVPSIRAQAAVYGDNTGWDSILHPPASWLMFSAPEPGGAQFVMNTKTGAWCRFTGMDARCWGIFKDKLYFGGPGGKVCEANAGAADLDANIIGDVQTAFNYLRSPQDKRITLARSIVEADSSIHVRVGSTTDFGVAEDLTAPISIATVGAKWNQTKWNAAKWATGTVQLRDWQAVNRIGSAISVRMRSETRGASVALFATDIVYERAEGIL